MRLGEVWSAFAMRKFPPHAGLARVAPGQARSSVGLRPPDPHFTEISPNLAEALRACLLVGLVHKEQIVPESGPIACAAIFQQLVNTIKQLIVSEGYLVHSNNFVICHT